MQDCFRQHPETYASEFEDDEDELEEELRARDAGSPDQELPTPPSKTTDTPEPSPKVAPEPAQSDPVDQPYRDSPNVTKDKVQKSGDEGEQLLPKAVHDARS
jgi:intermembrane space import and assembly protein 40